LSLTASLTLLDALAVLDHGTVSRDAGGTSIMGQATGHASSIRSQIQSALGEPLEQIAYNVLTSPARASDGTPVEPDATACAADIASVQAEARIVFAPSSAVINAESGRLLDRIAEIMRGCPATRFRIEGHTDSQGSESINLAISTARAESVLDSLLIRGVFLDRLEARGYGEARPIADNDTPEGRSLNRRIEFSAIPFDGGSP
jgi:OOP family OmpA-OmpF porin